MNDFIKSVERMNQRHASLLKHAINIPKVQMPEFQMQNIKVPTVEERHEYESAGELIKRLAARIRLWQEQLEGNIQPVILAILTNGASIRVRRLEQDGHNGIIIEGTVDDKPCMILAHQQNLQLLCFVEEIKEPEQKKEPIGFNYHGKNSQE